MKRMTFDEFLWALQEVREDGPYLKRVKELEEMLQEISAKTGVFTALEKVQELHDKNLADNERANLELEKKKDDLMARFKEFDAYKVSANDRILVREKEIADMLSIAGDEQNQANKDKQDAQNKWQETNEKLKFLAQKEQELMTREKELESKFNKLKEIL